MPCSFWPRNTGSSSRASYSASPSDSTLPCPKIPNTPANRQCSSPSTYVLWATRYRTSACAVVSRIVCIATMVPARAPRCLKGRPAPACSLRSLVVDLQAMLDAEAALADACADVGIVPREAADEIAAACRAELYDAAAIAADARAAGNPAIPLVKALTARLSPAAAAHVHRGATSQDIIDTASSLVARRTLPAIGADLGRAADRCAGLAHEHRTTPMAGRTLLQQAVPTTFGLKAAGWMTALDTAAAGLAAADARLAAQLGGAAGTLAALGDDGPAVAAAFARRLELVAPTLPWHTDRTGPASLAAALGVAAGAGGKVGLDIVLLAQTEVGEAHEAGEGRGGSSTMPHKRNPVAAVAADRRVPARTRPRRDDARRDGPRARARRRLVAGRVGDDGRAARRRRRRRPRRSPSRSSGWSSTRPGCARTSRSRATCRWRRQRPRS